VSEPPEARGAVDIGDATWQSEQAAHDTRVAFDCNTLGDLDRAHAHAITARTAVDAVWRSWRWRSSRLRRRVRRIGLTR